MIDEYFQREEKQNFMTDHYERLIDVQINLNDLKMFNDSLS